MPFQSEKQRRYLHANHPEIAKRWEKEYSNGGILDIDGSEEITTEEGNDISLVDESETGVSTLFKEKNNEYAIQGGGPNYLGKQPEVKVPRYWKSSPEHPDTELAYITEPEKQVLIDLNLHGGLEDGKPNTGPNGVISLQGDLGGWGNDPQGEFGGTTSSGGGSGQEHANEFSGIDSGGWDPGVASDTGAVTSDAGWDNTSPNVTNISGGDIWDWDDTSEVDDVIETYTNVKDRYDRNKTKQNWKMLASVLTGDIFGAVKNAYGMSKDKKAYEDMLGKLKADALELGIPTHSPHTDTLIQTIEQELIDINKKRDKDEDKDDDGPEVPVVAPVTEEIEDSYAMAGNWLQSYRDLKAKQALSASLQEKWADEREWQQNTMFANSGGLANLFRVKN